MTLLSWLGQPILTKIGQRNVLRKEKGRLLGSQKWQVNLVPKCAPTATCREAEDLSLVLCVSLSFFRLVSGITSRIAALCSLTVLTGQVGCIHQLSLCSSWLPLHVYSRLFFSIARIWLQKSSLRASLRNRCLPSFCFFPLSYRNLKIKSENGNLLNSQTCNCGI